MKDYAIKKTKQKGLATLSQQISRKEQISHVDRLLFLMVDFSVNP